MGLWDSIKKGAGDFSQLTTLQNKIKSNQQLSPEENIEFEKLAKCTVQEDIEKHPMKYFKSTSKYGSIEIDEKKQLFKIGFDAYTFTQLNSYELLENGSAITSGGLGIGRAIVGGVLLGGVGAVLGGVTKKRKQTNYVESLKIFVTFKNTKKTSTTIDYIKKKQEKDKKYEKILLNAQETLSGFDFITNYLENSHHETLIGSVNNLSNENSSADELRKFKALLDDGIISDREFEEKKNRILNL